MKYTSRLSQFPLPLDDCFPVVTNSSCLHRLNLICGATLLEQQQKVLRGCHLCLEACDIISVVRLGSRNTVRLCSCCTRVLISQRPTQFCNPISLPPSANVRRDSATGILIASPAAQSGSEAGVTHTSPTEVFEQTKLAPTTTNAGTARWLLFPRVKGLFGRWVFHGGWFRHPFLLSIGLWRCGGCERE